MRAIAALYERRPKRQEWLSASDAAVIREEIAHQVTLRRGKRVVDKKYMDLWKVNPSAALIHGKCLYRARWAALKSISGVSYQEYTGSYYGLWCAASWLTAAEELKYGTRNVPKRIARVLVNLLRQN